MCVCVWVCGCVGGCGCVGVCVGVWVCVCVIVIHHRDGTYYYGGEDSMLVQLTPTYRPLKCEYSIKE